ncbi:glycosyltransferase involved in cell wall biosynthesis [Halorubrum alkaliphilum]|uniref:Glycosyltransferase involved in cell wall biosynthesis n=1 Tax=Halorubrum alkaliphilum TaxID=261290 RepID=A0A8T4GHN8_9EURY|nr:glycosyltransferase family 4 protein [Halorubrum alkaliphilum]MBP1924084.1 glycosyltransferase involved in cell wall biosynthesis [Halorubrum alkaliphilum]
MRPHVCFVSDTLHTYLGSGIETGAGGAERQQYKIATALVDRGYDVTVLTRAYGSLRRETVEGIDVRRVIPDTRGVQNAPRKAARILAALREVDADLHYVRGNPFLCMVTALFTRTVGRGAFCYQVANDSNVEPGHLAEMNPLLRRGYLAAIRSADAVCALTPYQRDLLADEHGVDATVVPCGYDLPPESDLIDHADRETVLWVGRMNEDQKKPMRFLDLAEALPDREFVMVGPHDNDDPDYYDRVERRAETIPNCNFKGFVPPDEIHEYFRQAALLVNTSDYEGFGNVFLEAWRYETPVVSLHYTLHGVIDKEPVGVHAGSTDSLPEAVEDLLVDVDHRREYGVAGREHVADEYSFPSVLAVYETVFDRIAPTE